jgi:diguanylate cyclase (GGDEF)-like protein/PAS domain S-box-containing protein
MGVVVMAEALADHRSLIEASRLLRTLLHALPDAGLVVVDRAFVIRFMAGPALERHGWDAATVMDRPLVDVVPRASYEAWLSHYEAGFAGESSVLDVPTIDGAGMFRARFIPVTGPDGEVEGVAAVLQDITDQSLQGAALERSEHEYRLLAENGSDLIARHDGAGICRYASPAAWALLGFAPDEIVGRPARDFIHPEDVERVQTSAGAVTASATRRTITFRARHRDGRWIWVESVARQLVGDDGELVEIQSATRDISDRLALRAAEHAAQERFRVSFDQAPIGMALIGLDGRWIRVNRAVCEITGWPAEQLLTKTFQDITHPDDLDADLAQLERLLAGEITGYEMEKRYFTRRGEQIWVLLSVALVRDDADVPQYFISQLQDISERKRMEDSLHHLADHDPLTGLWNRRRFEEELHRQLARSRRTGESAALLMFDLDNFKYVNDTLGHKVGDDLIRHVGRAVRDGLRETDAVARLGGDEFAVLLPGVLAAQAVQLAEKVCETVRSEPVRVGDGDGEVHATASVGVAVVTRATGSEQDALIEADLAMYEAKARGRNRVVAYEDQLDSQRHLSHGMVWSQKLSQAVAEERFVLFAQPIVDAAEGRPLMYELLLRLVDDDGSLIGPSAFVYTAERFGIMRQIDRWVLRRAIELLAEYHESNVRLSVNLSGRSVTDPALPDYIEGLITRDGIDPRRLTVELTETEAIANMEQAKRLCRRLHRLGCLVALDDFGSGFASFSYLKESPIDFLKIDGEFIRHFLESPTDQLVVRAVHDVAQGMGKHTIAEYVEDDATRAALAGVGIDFVQGHLFGRPRPVDEVLRAIR